MESRLNDMRIMGMPVQFVAVVAISLALTIYFGAWAADARISERAAQTAGQSAQQFNFASASSSSSASGISGRLGSESTTGVSGSPYEAEGWEKAFLFACPLH